MKKNNQKIKKGRKFKTKVRNSNSKTGEITNPINKGDNNKSQTKIIANHFTSPASGEKKYLS